MPCRPVIETGARRCCSPTHPAKALASCSSWPREPGRALAHVWYLEDRDDKKKPKLNLLKETATPSQIIEAAFFSPCIRVDPQLEPLAVDVIRERLDPVREGLLVRHEAALQRRNSQSEFRVAVKASSHLSALFSK
jgi:hypothetical protein